MPRPRAARRRVEAKRRRRRRAGKGDHGERLGHVAQLDIGAQAVHRQALLERGQAIAVAVEQQAAVVQRGEEKIPHDPTLGRQHGGILGMRRIDRVDVVDQAVTVKITRIHATAARHLGQN